MGVTPALMHPLLWFFKDEAEPKGNTLIYIPSPIATWCDGCKQQVRDRIKKLGHSGGARSWVTAPML